MSVLRSESPVVGGGCHRSGTSLVRRLLDAHPPIHCRPAVPFFRDFYGNYLGDALHWAGTRDLWEQVDPELRWSYRQPQGGRP